MRESGTVLRTISGGPVVAMSACGSPYAAHMITYQSARWWRSPWLVLTLLAAGLGGYAWWRARQPVVPVPPVTASVQAARPAAPLPALLVPPQVLADGRPSDFSPEDWAALNDAMARTPNPRAELERVVKYLRFQKGFEHWQSLQAGDTAQRRELAQRLLDQVPERLRQSEVTYAEAAMLQAALLVDIEPDEGRRKARMQAMEAELRAAAPQIDPAQQARNEAMEREYKRREAAILADHQARPEAQRDQARLEKELEAARRAVWGAPQ